MKKRKIHEWEDIWEDIKDRSTHNLLLGNGASIAINESFDYSSLHQKASEGELLSKNLQRLFELFNTKNFELILRRLSDTRRVNEILSINESTTSESYEELRDALVNTVRWVHPQHPDVKSYLARIANFMMSFDKVISLNYDLLVYWAMRVGDDLKGKNRLKDCFRRVEVDGDLIFEDAFDEYMEEPYRDSEAATLIFYPHGNLVLATKRFGKEIKLSRSKDDCLLLDKILEKWQLGDYTPLFVGEGETRDKKHAIEQSNYLTNVYNRVLATLKESLVIYGWSFDDRDKHILDAIDRAALKEIAISVYTKGSDYEEYCNTVEKKISSTHNLKNCKIYFFDAGSKGCWIY